MSFSLDDIRAEFTPARTTASVCFDGALLAEIEAAEDDLKLAIAVDERENREPEAPGIAQRISDLHDQAKAKERTFTFMAIGKRAWSDLLSQHPPTEEQRKEGLDHDPATFPPLAIAACAVEPKVTEADALWMYETLSLGQFQRLWMAVLEVNLGTARPKAQLSDTVTRLLIGRKSATSLLGESPAPSSSDE